MEGRIDTDVFPLRSDLLYHLIALDKDIGGTCDVDSLTAMVYEAVVTYRIALTHGVGDGRCTSNL